MLLSAEKSGHTGEVVSHQGTLCSRALSQAQKPACIEGELLDHRGFCMAEESLWLPFSSLGSGSKLCVLLQFFT